MKRLRYTIPFIMLFAALSLCGCKPTPRTARDHGDHAAKGAAETQQGQEAQPKAPEATPAKTPEAQKPAQVGKQGCPAGLLDVHTAYQEYEPLRPWEKGPQQDAHAMGVYLGKGQVLAPARGMSQATFVEISLPDMSRTVPAKVLKLDDDLGLALLTVLHEEDADIFKDLPVLEVGEPIGIDGRVRLHALVQGEIPVDVELVAESASLSAAGIPLLTTRSQTPLPHGMQVGLPALKDGRLTGLVVHFNGESQTVGLLNAEMLRRFLEQTPKNTGVPEVGLSFAGLDDPVFCKYLKLNPKQGGLYVSEVVPWGAGAKAGIQKGDVLVGIEGIPLDKRGKLQHPIYGMLEANVCSFKPQGETIVLDISRDGQVLHLSVPLNRDAIEKGPFCFERAGTRPRYIMWGGLLFQPLTENYLSALKKRARSLPLSFIRAREQKDEMSKAGRQEVVALTSVIPTPATLGYENLGFCIVDAVNGTPVTSFAQFTELLDAETPDGITELTLSHAPYKIYVDRKAVEMCNEVLRRDAVPQLRNP